MKRVKVSARNLISVGYDAETQLLEVEFADGSVYQVLQVSASVHMELINSLSIDTYFDENIRDNYLCQQVYPATQ